MGIELKDGTELQGATNQYGNEIAVYDDYFGALWICGEEFGPTWVIRAQSMESAYDIWTDERPTIPVEELYEAHGFETEFEFQCAVDAPDFDWDRWNCGGLAEGYTYQSNSSGTGIVSTGHYEWIQELTPDYIRDADIRLRIVADAA